MKTGDGAAHLRWAADALRRGDNLAAVDAAQEALASEPSLSAQQRLQAAYIHVLALARSGARTAAWDAHQEHRLDGARSDDHELDEDLAALTARLSKDDALAATGADRRRLASAAAAAYGEVWERFHTPYAAVNAATLSVLAGQQAAAERWAARAATAATDAARDDGTLGAYWRHATTAELSLIRRDLDAVERSLAAAHALDAPPAARATTRAQLRLLARELGVDLAIVDELGVPSVVTYTGHVLRCDPVEEAGLRADVDAALARHDAGVVVGALAAGADVIVAEAALARGADLHVVLPFDWEEFAAVSIDVAGEEWRDRARACREVAASEVVVAAGSYVSDLQFAVAAEVAMGLAVLHADALSTTPIQLAVWDGQPPGGPAGTAADVSTWRRSGRDTVVIEPVGERVRSTLRPPDGLPSQQLRAVLFADVHGFSTLGEAQIPWFFEEIMGRLAVVLDAAGQSVEYRNSWGDGLYVVCRDVGSAAQVALALRDAIEAVDLDGQAFALRIGAHAGLVFRGVDPVRDEVTFFGGTTTLAARIEPRTPPGAVYVTEEFASLLRMTEDFHGRAEYVGRVPLAKSAGSVRMRVLEG